MGIPAHQTCLLRNLYAGQEATVRTGHGPTDWLQIGKGVRQGCILYPSQLQGKIGLPRANPRGSLKSPSFSRIQTQLEKNDVVPTSSQDEALARDGAEVRPSSEKTASEKRSPGTTFHPGCEMLFTGSKASDP